MQCLVSVQGKVAHWRGDKKKIGGVGLLLELCGAATELNSVTELCDLTVMNSRERNRFSCEVCLI